MEGAESGTKPRSCTTCKRAIKGHPGPYGPQCPNLPTSLAEDIPSRTDRPDSQQQQSRKERIDSQRSVQPSNEEFNELLSRINELLHGKRDGPRDTHGQNESSLPYFAEHIHIPDDLHRMALEGNFIDLTKLAPSNEESEPALSAASPETQAKKKRPNLFQYG